MASKKLYDVLIIGGGPGGLSCATSLARQTYETVVFDSGVYRNARATHMHNVLGFDHVPPADFRAKARQDLQARYSTTTFASTEVKTVFNLTPPGDNSSTLFRATDGDGQEWFGRKLVLATGVTDVFPQEIEGFDACFGRGIFHCLFCHGYEERGVDSIGVLAMGLMSAVNMALHVGYMAKPLGKAVRVYTHGSTELAEQLEEKTKAVGFSIETRRIKAVRMSGREHEVVVTLEDGTEVTEGFLAHAPATKLNGPFAEQLGLETTEMGDLKVTPPFSETSVRGVVAVGDCSNPMKAVAFAAAAGAVSAAGLVAKLASEPAPSLDL